MDLGMDLCILLSLQLALGEPRIGLLLCAQLLLSGATLISLACGGAEFLRLPVMVLCAAALTGDRRPERILQAVLCMLALNAAAAGFCLLGGRFAAGAGAFALGLLLRRQRHIRHRWNIDVRLELDGLRASFPALIDTGNRLRDPVSREPVLIVEAEAVPELARHMQDMNPARLQAIPFGVLGSAGELFCFQPDDVRILLPGRNGIEAPPCRAAVYHGRIPGRIRALAPPEFADAVARDTSLQGITDRARRVFYGFFKCKAIHLRSGGADSQGFGVLHRRQ